MVRSVCEGGWYDVRKKTILTSVLLLMAGELNVKAVPVVTVPVLVIESAWLASYTKYMASEIWSSQVSYGGTRTGNAEVTSTSNESLSDGKNLRGSEGDIKGLRDGCAARQHIQNCLVARLNGRNAGSGREDVRVPYA